MAQRLVRTLCPHCKVAAPISPTEWASVVGNWKLPKPETQYRAVGCLECRNTGYRGRIGIYEMFSVSTDLKKLIKPETDLEQLRLQAYREGMQPLMVNGAEKIAAGLTTIEELMKVAPPLE